MPFPDIAPMLNQVQMEGCASVKLRGSLEKERPSQIELGILPVTNTLERSNTFVYIRKFANRYHNVDDGLRAQPGHSGASNVFKRYHHISKGLDNPLTFSFADSRPPRVVIFNHDGDFRPIFERERKHVDWSAGRLDSECFFVAAAATDGQGSRMVCIVDYCVVVFLGEEVFKELEEPCSIALFSVLGLEPDLVEFNKLFPGCDQRVKDFSVIPVSGISFDILLCVGLMPDCMAENLPAFPPNHYVSRV